MSQIQTHIPTQIIPIKAFTDNYIWALTNITTRKVVIVDPGDANVVIEFLEQHDYSLSAILITHHHPDHTGGINLLREYCQSKNWPLNVYGPDSTKITGLTNIQRDDDTINLPQINLSFKVMEIPGHTLDHIAYYTNGLIFCGDTLFSAGCGRLFEGTPKQMLSSLHKLKELPEDTAVYCTHEYTLANINFALAVEPDNMDLVYYYNHVQELVSTNTPSLPSTIAHERLINPFLRCNETTIKTSAAEYSEQFLTSELEVFTEIRRWKDKF